MRSLLRSFIRHVIRPAEAEAFALAAGATVSQAASIRADAINRATNGIALGSLVREAMAAPEAGRIATATSNGVTATTSSVTSSVSSSATSSSYDYVTRIDVPLLTSWLADYYPPAMLRKRDIGRITQVGGVTQISSLLRHQLLLWTKHIRHDTGLAAITENVAIVTFRSVIDQLHDMLTTTAAAPPSSS